MSKRRIKKTNNGNPGKRSAKTNQKKFDFKKIGAIVILGLIALLTIAASVQVVFNG